MKWIFLLIVLAAGGFAFWKFQDQIFDAVDSFSQKSEELPEGSSEGDGNAPNGNGNNNSPGSKTAGGDSGPSPEERYPLPTFPPIEQLVSNWESVPDRAFPREVILKTKVSFKLANGQGSTVVKSGNKALALSLAGGQLHVAPRVGSTLRGYVALDQTDFKIKLSQAYDAYKLRKKEAVLKQRERARYLANTPSVKSQAPPTSSSASKVRDPNFAAAQLKEYEAKVGKMPARSSDGTVAIMVDSIRQKKVTEITLDEISSWGPIQFEEVEGKPYWTATVTYETTSLFGTFPTEAMALMKHGKVEMWVYTGSLEEVP